MSTVFVSSRLFKVPMLCVACAEPTVMPASPAEKRASSVEASASSRSGNTVTTEKVSFQLCPACTAARAQAKYRKHHYPGHWWTQGVGILAAAAFCGWVELNESATVSGFAAWLFVLFVAATITATVLSVMFHARNERDDPMSEADLNRLALIEGAVSISPPAGSNPLGAALTFKNETFAQVFAAANSPEQLLKSP